MGTNIRELEAQLDKVYLQLNAEKETNENLRRFMKKATLETDTLINRFRTFCTNILEKDITTGNITSSDIQRMNLDELLTAAEQSYKAELNRNQEIYIQFANKLQDKNRLINGLTAQNSQLQTKLAACGDTSNLSDPKNDADIQKPTVLFNHENAETIAAPITNEEVPASKTYMDAFAKSIVKESSAEQVSQLRNKKIVENKPSANDETYIVQSLYSIEKEMTDIMWDLLRLIGREGLSENSEIQNQIILEAPEGQKPSINKIREALNVMKKSNILRAIKINTGLRWFFGYELADNGETLYIKKFKSKPVESEMQRLKREHENYIHGYAIKDATAILERKYDYDSVSNDRKKNYIKIDGHRASVPDIICTGAGKTHYFEVECGNHVQADFNDKCDKLKMITNELYFVVPRLEVIKKLDSQIEAWISASGGRAALAEANIVVYLDTLKSLKDKKHCRIYTMDRNEPIILEEE